ncbi:hypothetical protein KDRO_C06420 [Kluyveromyces lactis]|nr:hypothetical protein KDRO_C06420 [Kluyveromyces lactis]
MKLSSVVATALAAASSALAAKTTVTATLGDHVYTKTIDIPDADETAPSGYYLSTIIVTRGDTVYTKVITEQSTVATAETTSSEETTSVIATAADEETTSSVVEETSSTEEASTTEYETKTLTLTKNGHVFTKTVTQPVGFVWTGEPSRSAATTSAEEETTSSVVEETSSTEEASTTEYETKTLTLTKNGHVFTKTVTQPVGFVWTGEPSRSAATTSAEETPSTEEASTTLDADELETVTLTLSKNGHWFTKTVTQTKGFVWTGEPSRSAATTSAEESSAAEEASSTEYETKTLTLTKNGHVFTKTVTQPVGFVWTGEPSRSAATTSAEETPSTEEASTTLDADELETVTLTLSKNGHWFTKTVTQTKGFVWTGEPSRSAATTSAEESSAAEEASSTEYETKTLTLTKNGHVFTKTVTQPVGFVWTGEPSRSAAITSSTEEASTTLDADELETVTLTLSKNGHWFTKTVTQTKGFVWTGEPSRSAATTSAEESSAAEEASSTEYETKTLTLTKNGHVFTKTVTQPVGFVWTGEPSRSAAITSSTEEASTTLDADELETVTLTLSKNGHWFTKTVTQTKGFVWTGEPSRSAATSSSDEASDNASTTLDADELETKTLTLTKNGHVFTKTVTQSKGFVWTGEPSRSAAITSAEESSDNASTTLDADELETKTLTLTKNGHVFTKTVTQSKGFVWTGEPSRSATASDDSNDDITSYSNSTTSATDSTDGQSTVSIETQTVTDKSSTTATITSCSEGVCHTTTVEPSASTVVTTVVDGVTIVTTVPCTTTSTVECTEEQCQKTKETVSTKEAVSTKKQESTKEPESTVITTVVEGVTVTSTIPCSEGVCQKTTSEQPALKTSTNGNDQQSAVKTTAPGDNVQPTTTATRIDTVKTTIVKSTSTSQSSPAQTVSTYTGGAVMASVGTGIFAAAMGVMLL